MNRSPSLARRRCGCRRERCGDYDWRGRSGGDGGRTAATGREQQRGIKHKPDTANVFHRVDSRRKSVQQSLAASVNACSFPCASAPIRPSEAMHCRPSAIRKPPRGQNAGRNAVFCCTGCEDGETGSAYGIRTHDLHLERASRGVRTSSSPVLVSPRQTLSYRVRMR